MFGLFKKRPVSPPAVSPVVDLDQLSCDDLELGRPIPLGSPYLAHFLKDPDEPSVRIYKNPISGIEVTTARDLIDSIFISLESFTGVIIAGGNPIKLTVKTTESEASELLGEPWWKHVDDDLEVIDFYEREAGTIEIQMEYPALCDLRFITILREGVLSNAEQREAYGVTKPWPPASDN